MNRLRLAALLLFLAAVGGTPHAEEWQWLSEFTDESDPGLIQIHEAVFRVIPGLTGIPVKNVSWSEDGFEIHIKDGMLFPEPATQGTPSAAYFEGEATFSFRPKWRKGKADLNDYFSREAFEEQPVSHGYFWTLREQSILEQMDIHAEPSVPMKSPARYVRCKKAMRQLGTRGMYWVLNGDHRSKNTALVLMAVDEIREAGHPDSYLLYRYDTSLTWEVQLYIFGHSEVSGDADSDLYHFKQLVIENWDQQSTVQGEVERYKIKLSLNERRKETTEHTEIQLQPGKGVHALRLDLIPWMKVVSVKGCQGEPLPFAQWSYVRGGPNWDPRFIVAFPDVLSQGEICTFTVSAEGFIGSEEDNWFPHPFETWHTSYHELEVDIKKNEVVIAPGHLVLDEQRDGRRYYHYKTSHKQQGFSMYDGEYRRQAGTADNMQVEVYVHRKSLDERKKQQFVLTEISNMLKVYNRLLIPLDIDTLRVVSTWRRHGRGFEGLLLLGSGGFESWTAELDTFRAHEVAHQWWGNMVRPKSSIRDRWLSEALAEYMAMEYYSLRYQGRKKLSDLVRRKWTSSLRHVTSVHQDLAGKEVTVDRLEHWPLEDGGSDVYGLGPIVVHMLRYMMQEATGGDEAFWEVLRGILRENKDGTISTQDFIGAFEKRLDSKLDWFLEQWYRGRRIPEVTWSHTVEKSRDGWLLTVDAEQTEEFRLFIPIYIHFSGKRVISRPLILDGKSGRRKLMLPERPKNVTLNDFYESMVVITK